MSDVKPQNLLPIVGNLGKNPTGFQNAQSFAPEFANNWFSVVMGSLGFNDPESHPAARNDAGVRLPRTKPKRVEEASPLMALRVICWAGKGGRYRERSGLLDLISRVSAVHGRFA
ncbi:hypothetical protein [Bradyrhizobium sp. CCGUVB14]|uniref:hypothetical protein n=1 Tax=Bradyrhizobium sp. CCGUVB14 TaxID=2949628 RepID=UPI0020B382A3|nr:hypothetical protein [Bradyrhizobium sp. CCGUVB14]MCP3446541.1 hypothetical protein [Bradyrhizobium sp. CCGUVB14]